MLSACSQDPQDVCIAIRESPVGTDSARDTSALKDSLATSAEPALAMLQELAIHRTPHPPSGTGPCVRVALPPCGVSGASRSSCLTNLRDPQFLHARVLLPLQCLSVSSPVAIAHSAAADSRPPHRPALLRAGCRSARALRRVRNQDQSVLAHQYGSHVILFNGVKPEGNLRRVIVG